MLIDKSGFEKININIIDYEQLIEKIKKLNPQNPTDLYYATWYSLSEKRLYRKQTVEILNIITQLDNNIKTIRNLHTNNISGVSSIGYKQYKEIIQRKTQ